LVHVDAVRSLAQSLSGRRIKAVSVSKVWLPYRDGVVGDPKPYALKGYGFVPVEGISVRLRHSDSPAAQRSVRDVKSRIRRGSPDIRMHEVPIEGGGKHGPGRYLVLYSPIHARLPEGLLSLARKLLVP